MTTLLGFFAAGVELAGILPFLLSHSGGTDSGEGGGHAAPEGYLLAMAILSAVGLGLGVLRHYWDIYVHRSVRGISFSFVFLDAAGDLTSLLSVGASLSLGYAIRVAKAKCILRACPIGSPGATGRRRRRGYLCGRACPLDRYYRCRHYIQSPSLGGGKA